MAKANLQRIYDAYDDVLKANYNLCAIKLSELKELAKSWYVDSGIEFSDFDKRYMPKNDDPELIEMKMGGLVANYFFAYEEDGKFYLLDGFNRLFTEYGVTDHDPVVYVKLIRDKLEDYQLMHIMFRLNMWKLKSKKSWGGIQVDDFFDRGFALFLYSKFGIKFYSTSYAEDGEGWYKNRKRSENDMNIVSKYFKRESDTSGDYSYGLAGISVILHNKKFVSDLKQILEINDYRPGENPFNNYTHFIYGFAMFLSWRRVNGDEKDYLFEYYLNKFYEDKKFSKKLPGMSGNDTTRKNVHTWYRDQYYTDNKQSDDFKMPDQGNLKL